MLLSVGIAIAGQLNPLVYKVLSDSATVLMMDQVRNVVAILYRFACQSAMKIAWEEVLLLFHKAMTEQPTAVT